MKATEWRDGFLFVGNHLALDFLNTCPVQDGVALELLPDFGSLLRWAEAAGVLTGAAVAELRRASGDAKRAERTVREIREYRERLRKWVTSWRLRGEVPREAQAELNHLMRQYPMLTRLDTTNGKPTTAMYFSSDAPECLFAPLAYSAAMLFAHEDGEKVRQCDNCVLLFLDTSKKGTRRWCSMRLCGNRIKVAAYAERQKAES